MLSHEMFRKIILICIFPVNKILPDFLPFKLISTTAVVEADWTPCLFLESITQTHCTYCPKKSHKKVYMLPPLPMVADGFCYYNSGFICLWNNSYKYWFHSINSYSCTAGIHWSENSVTPWTEHTKFAFTCSTWISFPNVWSWQLGVRNNTNLHSHPSQC